MRIEGVIGFGRSFAKAGPLADRKGDGKIFLPASRATH